MKSQIACGAGLFALTLVSAGCVEPPPPPPPPPVPPQVSVSVASTDVVGTGVPFTVHLSGCTQISKLEIYDGPEYLKDLPAQQPSTQGRLEANELSYRRGLALNIALRAKVFCADGREALSRTQAVTFLPVASVTTLPEDEQVVPDLFEADGSGASLSFIGCIPTENGLTAVARVDPMGRVLDTSLPLPFQCTWSSVFTERHATSGKRWLWDAAGGAVAFDDQLGLHGRFLGAMTALSVEPGGDAIVVRDTPRPMVSRHRHAQTQELWSESATGLVIGEPVVHASLGVMTPVMDSELTGLSDRTIAIVRFDLATGERVGHRLMLTGSQDTVPFSDAERFPVKLRADGSQLYLPRLIADGTATIRACATDLESCRDAALAWESPPLGDWPAALIPFASGSRLAVVGSGHANFLNAAGGGIANPGVIKPQGAQYFSAALPGKGTDFYLMSSPLSQPGALPSELIAVDQAELGELFRYQVPAGSLTVAVDAQGLPWLRLNSALVKPLRLSEYRAVLTAP